MPKFAKPSMPQMPSFGGKGGCCGALHPITNAAVAGTLQAIAIAIFVSHAGTLYNQWDNYYLVMTSGQVIRASDQPMPPGGQGQDPALMKAAARSYLKIHLANTVAIHAIWAVCLAVFLPSFHYYRSVMVLPNVIVQFIALIWQFIFIVLIAASCEWVPTGQQVANYFAPSGPGYASNLPPALSPSDVERLKFIVYTVLLLCAMFIMEVYCATAVVGYYRYLSYHDANTAVPPGYPGNAPAPTATPQYT